MVVFEAIITKNLVLKISGITCDGYVTTIKSFLGGLKGWDVCERIKSNEKLKHIPVVMFTIRTREGDMKHSFNLTLTVCSADLSGK